MLPITAAPASSHVVRAATASELADEAARSHRRGRSAALCHGSDQPPVGIASPSAFRAGHAEARREMDEAFVAGWNAALEDASPTPPGYGGPDGDDLDGCWLEGWEDGSQVLVAREAAWMEEQAEAMEWADAVERGFVAI